MPYHVVYFKPFLNSETYKFGDFYKVEIIEGQYWGTHGLSNFWYWYRLNEDGCRDIEECGYGAFYSLD